MDEPWGRNDGSVAVPAVRDAEEGGGEGEDEEEGRGEERKRYFTCRPNFGVFVRPERVVKGDFEVLRGAEEEDDDEMEEI